MKRIFNFIISFLLIGTMIAGFSGCGTKCDPNAGVKIGEQFFTVTYLDPAGGNYLTNGAWDLNQVIVRVDATGGKSANGFTTLPQTFVDSKFGPFFYTKNFLSPTDNQPNLNLLLAKTFKYDYYIRKGALNQEDVIRVEFRLTANDCNLEWNTLRYYKRNNATNLFEAITELEGNQKPELVFIQ